MPLVSGGASTKRPRTPSPQQSPKQRGPSKKKDRTRVEPVCPSGKGKKIIHGQQNSNKPSGKPNLSRSNSSKPGEKVKGTKPK